MQYCLLQKHHRVPRILIRIRYDGSYSINNIFFGNVWMFPRPPRIFMRRKIPTSEIELASAHLRQAGADRDRQGFIGTCWDKQGHAMTGKDSRGQVKVIYLQKFWRIQLPYQKLGWEAVLLKKFAGSQIFSCLDWGWLRSSTPCRRTFHHRKPNKL